MNTFIQAWREQASKNKKFQRAGMTLIEIMIVITLMAALMAVIGSNVLGSSERANVKMAEMDLQNFKSAITQYKVFFKKSPSSLNDLIHTPDNNPLLDAEEIQKDPWGNDYALEKNGNKIKISSFGPDGIENTEDDISISI
ncbi:MAG: type II secretion system protein GspG [Proteobacteria bacterium]|jgi:general secretion pathway protein G|nr:type II secretion system protein GspG [Pseudomonadota bacterium]